MQRFFPGRLLILLLAASAVAAADSLAASADQTPTQPPADTSEVRVTGKMPHSEAALPALAPDEFSDCYRNGPHGIDQLDPLQVVLCAAKRDQQMHVVIEACVNPEGNKPPSRVIQACGELLDRQIFAGRERFPMYVNRARAYFALGDKERALADFNEAVTVAPSNAKAYYSRGAYFLVQADYAAALKDFDAAIRLDRKAVQALRLRAKLYQAQGNFDGAVADYSEAIRWQEKSAALWSERGYVRLRQRDNAGALKDEAQAIQLDPKLARAYFYRGAALGGLGDSAKAVSDLQKAVDLDPSLDRYVTSSGKTASLTLPPI